MRPAWITLESFTPEHPMVQHLDFLVLAVSCRSEVQWWRKLLAFPWQSRGSLVVTQGSLPSWISKCMSNLQSLPYLPWTLKDAPWRLWRVSHPILSLIGLSRGEDQKLPTSLLRKGCKFCCYKQWNHITDSAATEFPTVGQVALPEALPQRPTWGLKDLLRSHKFQQFPGLGMSITRLYVDTP